MQAVLGTILSKYDVGQVTALSKLSDHGVFRIHSTGGDFVARPQFHPFEAELYECVADTLSSRGVRQPKLIRSSDGKPTVDGWWLREWLDGSVDLDPSRETLAAVFGHLAEFDHALADVRPPRALLELDTLFTKVMDTAWLSTNMPSLCERDRADLAAPVRRALDTIAGAPRVPTQLIHGDVGPDNVLLSGSRVVAIIDFTPHVKPRLASLACALYWYCVYPAAHLQPSLIDAAVGAYDRARPLTATEHAALPAALLLEAVRRVATPLALSQSAIGLGRVAALTAVLSWTNRANTQ